MMYLSNETLMTVSVTKDDENYTTVMVSLSNHESLSFDRLRMTRVEINNNTVGDYSLAILPIYLYGCRKQIHLKSSASICRIFLSALASPPFEAEAVIVARRRNSAGYELFRVTENRFTGLK
jgi:hypothetical protein